MIIIPTYEGPCPERESYMLWYRECTLGLKLGNYSTCRICRPITTTLLSSYGDSSLSLNHTLTAVIVISRVAGKPCNTNHSTYLNCHLCRYGRINAAGTKGRWSGVFRTSSFSWILFLMCILLHKFSDLINYYYLFSLYLASILVPKSKKDAQVGPMEIRHVMIFTWLLCSSNIPSSRK